MLGIKDVEDRNLMVVYITYKGRKLDYDCKKRQQQSKGQVPDKEIKQAEDKFAESLHLAQMGMFNIMENDVEQVFDGDDHR